MAKYKIPFAERGEEAVTPKGKALWAFLCEPDKRWKPEYGEFKINLIMKPGKESAKFIADLEKIRDEYIELIKADAPEAIVKKLVIRDVFNQELDAAEEETGNLEFKFSCPAGGKRKKDGKEWFARIILWDSQPKQIKGKINIGNDSIVQLKYTPSPYCMKSTETGNYMVGVKLYPNACMIHKLVEFAGGNADGFDAGSEDGFTYTEAGAEGFVAPSGDDADGNPDF